MKGREDEEEDVSR